MTNITELKIEALRGLNRILGLSNRRSKDENVRQIIQHMQDVYHYNGPYTNASIRIRAEIGDISELEMPDTSVSVDHNKLISDLVNSGYIDVNVIGTPEDPIPGIIEELHLNGTLDLRKYRIADSSEDESSESDVDNDEEEEDPDPAVRYSKNNDEEEDVAEDDDDDDDAVDDAEEDVAEDDDD